MNGLPRAVAAKALKRACAQLFKSLGGDDAAGMIVDKSHSEMQRLKSDHRMDRWVSLPDLAELEAHAAEPLVTQLLCRMAGGVFLKMPDVEASDEAAPMMVLQLAAELGDVAKCVTAALVDGEFTSSEATRVLEQLTDLDRCSAQMAAMMRGIIEREEGEQDGGA